MQPQESSHGSPGRALRRLAVACRRSLRGGVRRVFGTRYVRAPTTLESLRRQFDCDGYVSGGPLVDPARLEALRRECDRIFAERDRPEAGVDYRRVEEPGGREYYKIYDLRHLSQAFHDLVIDPKLSELATAITGCSRLRVLLDQIQYKPAHTGGVNGWHRDMASFPFQRPYRALMAWIPLDDVTEDNGALSMVPGSHTWGDASDIATNEWALDLSRIWLRYQGHWVRSVSRPMRAGHVHFHDDKTWHCSPPNLTDAPRRALAIHLFNADARYREGGAISYPGLSGGDSMQSIAPLVLPWSPDNTA